MPATRKVDRTTSNRDQHTVVQYGALQRAYDFFNEELFGGRLPGCLITWHRKANARGYFIGDVFAATAGGGVTSEIALNPETFADQTDHRILSTLAHEMAHLWQHANGNPGGRGYHNKEWAGKMKEIGLQPTDTGQPGGKEVGFKVTHYIVEGGPFDLAVARFTQQYGDVIRWRALSGGDRAARKKKSAKSKSKFSCPDCGQNAWAKPTAKISCGECDAEMACDDPEDGGEDGADA
ncbi:MAG: sprT domain-containing protein [Azospirillum sp.]|nr:sprT domain-containing protein [Azospirillum sp.]